MKTIASILAIFLFASATAQTKAEKIWKYANDHLGQKIGNGYCDELIIYAFAETCGCRVKEKVGRGRYRYYVGVEVSADSIKPGDIVDFRCFSKKTGKEVPGHVGVVNRISGEWIYVIHQNNGWTKRKDAFLLEADIDEITEGFYDYNYTITYYRPQ